MKKTVLFFTLLIAISVSAQEVVTLNRSTTRYSDKESITGNNGIYLRPSLGMGAANPFITYKGEDGNHLGINYSWGIHYRFGEKYWIGVGIAGNRFEKMYANNTYKSPYSYAFSPYVEFRINLKTWGTNSLFVGAKGGVNPLGWRGEKDYQPIWPGTTYYLEEGKPYFAFDVGMQFKRFDISILYESAFAKWRIENTSQMESIYAYNLLLNIAYNIRIIKLK